MEPSDARLWERAHAGDSDAFGALFERHAKLVYNFCFRRVGNWATAEDLLVLVFLEGWRRRDKKLPPYKVLPWLLGIANNVVRNQRRTERRYGSALRRISLPQPEPDFAETADERLDDETRTQQALGLLRRLPQREQEVFVLCAVMELSYGDAALALSLPLGTVRSRLARARAHLREVDAGFGHQQVENATLEEARQP